MAKEKRGFRERYKHVSFLGMNPFRKTKEKEECWKLTKTMVSRTPIASMIAFTMLIVGIVVFCACLHSVIEYIALKLELDIIPLAIWLFMILHIAIGVWFMLVAFVSTGDTRKEMCTKMAANLIGQCMQFAVIITAYFWHFIWLFFPTILIFPLGILTALSIGCQSIPDCVKLSDIGIKQQHIDTFGPEAIMGHVQNFDPQIIRQYGDQAETLLLGAIDEAEQSGMIDDIISQIENTLPSEDELDRIIDMITSFLDPSKIESVISQVQKGVSAATGILTDLGSGKISKMVNKTADMAREQLDKVDTSDIKEGLEKLNDQLENATFIPEDFRDEDEKRREKREDMEADAELEELREWLKQKIQKRLEKRRAELKREKRQALPGDVDLGLPDGYNEAIAEAEKEIEEAEKKAADARRLAADADRIVTSALIDVEVTERRARTMLADVENYSDADIEEAQNAAIEAREKYNEAKNEAERLSAEALEKADNFVRLAQDHANDARRRANDLLRKGKEFSEDAQRRAHELAVSAQTLADDAQTNAEELAIKAKERAEDFADAALKHAETAKAIAEDLAAKGADFATDAQRRALEIAKDAEAMAKDAQRRAEQIATEAQRRAQDAARYAQRRAEDAKRLFEDLTRRGVEFSEQARKMAEDFAKESQTYALKAQRKAEKALSDIKKKADELAKKAEKALEDIQKKAEKSAKELEQTARELAGKANETFHDLKDKAQVLAKDAEKELKKIEGKAKEFVDDAKEFTEESVERIVDTAKDIAKEAEVAAKQAAKMAAKAFEEAERYAIVLLEDLDDEARKLAVLAEAKAREAAVAAQRTADMAFEKAREAAAQAEEIIEAAARGAYDFLKNASKHLRVYARRLLKFLRLAVKETKRFIYKGADFVVLAQDKIAIYYDKFKGYWGYLEIEKLEGSEDVYCSGAKIFYCGMVVDAQFNFVFVYIAAILINLSFVNFLMAMAANYVHLRGELSKSKRKKQHEQDILLLKSTVAEGQDGVDLKSDVDNDTGSMVFTSI